MEKILYIDDEISNLQVFEATFNEYFKVLVAENTEKALQYLTQNTISVIITDQRMPKESGLEFISRVQNKFPDTVFMILTGYTDIAVAIKAIESGRVYRFIQKPWDEKKLLVDIKNALEKYNYTRLNKNLLTELEDQNQELIRLKRKLEDENLYLKEEIRTHKNFENIISEDENFLNILSSIEQVANSDAPCLIYGETGTGKELIARAIHNLSDRKDASFICVNCAAIPESLFESELFGHEKGAFTGATSQRKGKFELADKGTLFLDEIGEIPLSLQAKLLRAIQESSIERVGGSNIIRLDIRIVAATNRDLQKEVDNDNFRSDLYYRLNVFPIDLPPLRERKNDIPVLARFFLDKYAKKYKKNIKGISEKSVNEFKQYNWPGNVRELENVVERAVIISNSSKLNTADFLPRKVKTENAQYVSLEENERKYILEVLKKTNWKVSGKNSASEILNINRTTLISRMKKLNIHEEKMSK